MANGKHKKPPERPPLQPQRERLLREASTQYIQRYK